MWASGYGFEFGPSAVRKVISRVRPRPAFEYRTIEACAVDSQDMLDQHRRQVWEIIETSNTERIIITHGTDTIIQTAAFLLDRIKENPEKNRTIVLTGSFLPETFKESDADFNIGFAIGAASCLPGGVYVGMNGKIFPGNQVDRTGDGTFTLKI